MLQNNTDMNINVNAATTGSFSSSSTKATADAYRSTAASLHTAFEQQQELQQSFLPYEIQKIHTSRGSILKNILTLCVDFIFDTWNTMRSWIGISLFRCWMILSIAILIEICHPC
jgi:hypothetical protein